MIPKQEDGWLAVFEENESWLRRRVRDGMRRRGLRARPDEVFERVQEVYCRLLQGGHRRLRRLRRIQPKSRLVYLGRVADSVITDEIRAALAVKRGGGAVRCQPFQEHERNPEAALLRSEHRRILVRRLLDLADGRGLPRRDLRMLWLAVVEGWRSRDLARAFELKPRTVDNLLHRVRRQLGPQGLEMRRR
ncbi:MAG TPA: sigma factor-like helix-turn-helix DNA-binding protein [Thermoanaerobaculia bacterium]|nr:sigma factor-like helix-turn-helix DNA-binding protein [Thermoanaerobaculia bacterium]